MSSRGCSLEFARETRTAVTEADHSVELLDALHQGVRSSSNTGRVVAFVVREGAPFTTGVHDTISKNQTTTLADEVAAAEFL